MAATPAICRRCTCFLSPSAPSTSALLPLRSLHTSLPRRKRTVKVKEEVVPEHIRLERIKEEERKEALRYKPPDWNGPLAEGTPLGFKIYKDQPAPVALADDAYPSWLWRLLDRPASPGDPQRPGQVNHRMPIKEIRRQLDKERNSERALKMRSKMF